ncbi:aromatic compound dioxygenase [Fomitiporia mediterranea MF3/22]|uniref:aromatic compound dioxygenase n=1 Tax=Fomitiporia mediterranea (strain MF3/22) TaxID=694068 RepID=UPI000440878E|nr:aromatic compound dioxygenase [Fomitiporia mediterranea MF3/22]EJD02993.1 aromatic compound dioxygenase [Fomitiporia mediterranea MF3/22]
MASLDKMKNPLFVGKAIRAQLESEVPKDLPLDRDFREGSDYTITDHVNGLHASLCPDKRTLELFTSLINHIHAFARETRPTHAEWTKAIEYLTRAGKESTEFKNEFVLLSDCMGGCTDGCEPGPFYTTDAPEIPSGSSVAIPGTAGELLYFSATVKNTKGEEIQGVKAEMWQADGDGLYDVQYPGRPDINDRARIIAESNGNFNYRGILPVAYPIPNDGPIGDFLRALGRHPHRSSHIHFTLTAPGYDDLTTALYPSFSPFLGTDPVFATKKSLVTRVVEETDPKKWEEMGFNPEEVKKGTGRVWVWKYDFVLPSVEEVEKLKSEIKSKQSRL